MKRLPEVDLRYWVLILSATTLGETAGDLVSQSLGLGYGAGSLVLLTAFVVALLGQLRARRQRPGLYWTVILLTSTAGTTMSDFLTRSLALGYASGTLLLAAVLAVVIVVWRRVEGAAGLRGALDLRAEAVYWSAILASSTLGTAFGDLIANGTALGFAGGTAVLAVLLAGIAFATRFTRVSKESCYWLAIVVTHPIGATMGDFLTKPEGVGLGNVLASFVLLAVLALVSLSVRGDREVDVDLSPM